MINEENINKIYEGIINEIDLTTKNLNSFGLNSKDLKKLIEEGKLERITRGYYKLTSFEGLFKYAKSLLDKKEYEKAIKCFEKCYELNHNHPGTCFQLFFNSIKNKDYKKSFQYIDVLLNVENNYYKQDINYYLFLLNFITDIPQKYQEYVKNIQLVDIKIPNKDIRFEDVHLENKVRIHTINQKFAEAHKILMEINKRNRHQNAVENLSRLLLITAYEKKEQNKNKLLKLVKEKQYQEAIMFLESKSKKYKLNIIDTYTLALLKTIIDIKVTKKMPDKNDIVIENTLQAIDAVDYEKALKLSEEYNNNLKINKDENVIHLLLEDICELKEEIISQNNNKQLLVEIINTLLQANVDLSLTKISEYLKKIGKVEYEFIIVNLIKISVLKNDLRFVKPINLLIQISEGNYQFDLSEYVQYFFDAITSNNLEEATTHLNIITNAEKIGVRCAFLEGLKSVLELSKKQEIKTDEIGKEEPEEVDYKEINKPITNIQRKVPTKTYQQKSSQTLEDEKFIENKYQELLSRKGAILLKPMSKERRNIIYSIVASKYKDMRAFSVGTDDIKPIVLRYKPYIEEFINLKQIKSDGDSAYTNKEYEKCIECYLQLLTFGTPKAHLYAKLGLAYMKKFDIEKAIEYLTIATLMSKEEDGRFEFTELINSLKGITNQNAKPKVYMTEKEFKNDLNDYFGINNFGQINNYIIESKLDVETACKELSLNEEQTTLVKLIYAREYFSQEEYTIGDLFIQSVEKTKNKSTYVQKILETVRKNKKFYINRPNITRKTLSLILKPKK